MPRRSGRTSLANSVHLQTPELSAPAPEHNLFSADLLLLRTHWKWAAFCQFITTFSPMLNIPDVTVNDVESDLVSGTRNVIPRVMQRLLYTLTYDRKISTDNWQSPLRRQYLKRDPLSNPLGPEPPKVRKTESREQSPENTGGEDAQGHSDELPSELPDNQPSLEAQSQAEPSRTVSEISRATTQEVDGDEKKDSETHPTVDWFDLPVLAKLESMHLVTEWQFQNPTRLRMLMKSDDDLATWRHEPVGYDSKRNAYWLIGEDRLWIQRAPPKPAKTLKRKRPTETRKAARPEKSKPKPPKRRRTNKSTAQENTPQRTGRGRAAKLQAKIKLDAQAKELAALNKQAQARGTRQSTRSTRGSNNPPARPQGTRLSARLRGAQNNEWQSIPDEWLNESSDAGHESGTEDERVDPQVSKMNGEREDSVSDLTELSDDSDADDLDEKPEEQDTPDEQEEEEEDSPKQEEEENPAENFVEWETICVTLEEWEHVAGRFEKATHYLEKALYKYLTNEIVPNIVEALREVERKKRLEEALNHRKRSSRLAIKESEREEARLARIRKAEEEEKMGRARRLEARRQREEEERLKREQAREQRRKEREARELRRHAEQEEEEESNHEEEPAPSSKQPPAPPSSAKPSPQSQRAPRQRTKPSPNGTTPKARVKTGDWELDCEVCCKRGFNLDDRTPMMSCGKCFKWQHIACHDLADERAGRAKRNWDSVEFICQQCRSRMFAGGDGTNPALGDPRYNHQSAQGISLSSPYYNHTPYQSYAAQGYAATHAPQASTISSLYHAANGNYSHYAQSYGDPRAPNMPDRYPAPSQPYLPTHHYPQPPSTISFSHYQPRDGGFSSSAKSQSSYQGRLVDAYDQHPRAQQHAPYSDLRSSTSQRPTAPQPTQSVWSLGAPTSAGTYAPPYHSTLPATNGTPRRELQLQSSMKPGPSSSPNDFNQPSYPNSQFRYHSTT